MSLHSHVVAVFNTSEDTTDLLRVVFENAGFVVVTAFTNLLRDGKIDLETFMRQHQPRVIVYDIAIPYDHNWRLYEHMRGAPACSGVAFDDQHQARSPTGGQRGAARDRRKPYDLNQIVDAVKRVGGEPEVAG